MHSDNEEEIHKVGETNLGPEQAVICEDVTTCNLQSPVKLRIGDTEVGRVTPLSVPGLLKRAAEAVPHKPALAYKENPSERGFKFVTFREYYNMVKIVAKAFLSVGLQRLRTVAIIGYNSPEWFYSYLGAIYAGGIGCGIYTTNSADATYYCLKKGKANIVVVEDEKQAEKVLMNIDKLHHLKVIVQYSGILNDRRVLSWNDLIDIGMHESDSAIIQALKRIAINECCTLIFTSGTTGHPKGVMLNHDNLIWNAHSVMSVMNLSVSERMISFLPLSHVVALVVDVYCQLTGYVTMYFANKDALKGGLLTTLLEVKPTRFLAVPRVWEKLADKIKEGGNDTNLLKRNFIKWARKRGLKKNLGLMDRSETSDVGYVLAKPLFSKVKQKLGFDNCKTFWSGAAPLSSDVKYFLASFDILVFEGFGMSESSGMHTVNIASGFRFDSAGRTLPGSRTKIENPDHEEQGEICLFGRNIFMGYVDDPEQTNEAIDSVGWLHSGDLGKVDNAGFLTITGRIKELLITAGGENISPVLIEQNVKACLPFLGHAVVICDRQKFLSLLVTISCETDKESGEPTEELTPLAKKWIKDLGFEFTTISEVLESGPDKKILESIQEGLNEANDKAISHAQMIQKFVILPKDFSTATGELGPTLKLRRNFINEKYKNYITEMYSISSTDNIKK